MLKAVVFVHFALSSCLISIEAEWWYCLRPLLLHWRLYSGSLLFCLLEWCKSIWWVGVSFGWNDFSVTMSGVASWLRSSVSVVIHHFVIKGFVRISSTSIYSWPRSWILLPTWSANNIISTCWWPKTIRIKISFILLNTYFCLSLLTFTDSKLVFLRILLWLDLISLLIWHLERWEAEMGLLHFFWW